MVLKKLGLDENFICNKVKELLKKSKIELINSRKDDLRRVVDRIMGEGLSALK